MSHLKNDYGAANGEVRNILMDIWRYWVLRCAGG